MRPILLASASPRRRALIERMGRPFRAVEPAFEEVTAGDAGTLALLNATGKAYSALKLARGDELVVGCDTVVVKDGAVYGKPGDAADARRMLAALAGGWHEVFTGMCVLDRQGAGVCALETTRVKLCTLTAARIEAYIATGEPFDKAGAYGIQGGAGTFIEALEGDRENVVGMSTKRLESMLNYWAEYPNGIDD